jgi:hypothetical protein
MCPGGPAGFGYPGAVNLNATVVADVTKYPYCSMGKLFYTINGQRWVCSATSISEYVFLTAGHCLYQTDSHTSAQNIMFVAQYTGSPSALSFTAAKSGWFLQWENSQDENFDIGLVRTNESMKAIGNLALIVGDWKFFSCCPYAVGYPSQAPFPGTTMYQAYGTYTGNDLSYTHGMNGNNMTPGSSGGAWFIPQIYPVTGPTAYPKTASIVGLNTYSNNGPAPPMYSPEMRFPMADLWYCVNNSC